MEINKFIDFVSHIDRIVDNAGQSIQVLFRGQSENNALKPSIDRKLYNGKNLTDIEKIMIDKIDERGYLKNIPKDSTYLDKLVIGQHYGLKTRLLDWTTNPMVALWFASSNEYHKEKNSYVYILTEKTEPNSEKFNSKECSITKLSEPYIIRPNKKNERIYSQNGCFTIHPIRDSNRDNTNVIKLEEKYSISVIEILSEAKENILLKLDTIGINYESIFPDKEGLFKQLNWEAQIPSAKMKKKRNYWL